MSSKQRKRKPQEEKSANYKVQRALSFGRFDRAVSFYQEARHEVDCSRVVLECSRGATCLKIWIRRLDFDTAPVPHMYEAFDMIVGTGGATPEIALDGADQTPPRTFASQAVRLLHARSTLSRAWEVVKTRAPVLFFTEERHPNGGHTVLSSAIASQTRLCHREECDDDCRRLSEGCPRDNHDKRLAELAASSPPSTLQPYGRDYERTCPLLLAARGGNLLTFKALLARAPGDLALWKERSLAIWKTALRGALGRVCAEEMTKAEKRIADLRISLSLTLSSDPIYRLPRELCGLIAEFFC